MVALPMRIGSAPATVVRSSVGARRPVTRAPVSLSLAQVANRQVNQQIAPQEQSQNAFNARQSQVIQSFANALLGKLQPIAGQVGSDYDQAIQQTGALANQSAQFLKDQNPSGQVAQLLASAGAPQAQQDQITGQLGQTFGGGAGVLSFLGGAVPGGQMAADKAAAQGQAAQLPGLAALRGQQDLASALWQQGQDRSKLEATRPALYQKAASDIRTNNLARGKMAQSASQYAQTRADKQAQFAATRADKQAATDFLNWYRTQGVNATEAKINQKAAEFGVTSGQRQQSIGIAQQRAGIAQQNANTSSRRADIAAKKTGKKGGVSSTSYAGLRTKAGKAMELWYWGDAKKQVSGIGYGQAVKRAMDVYSLSKKDAQTLANDYYAPGEAGRPATPQKPSRPLTAKVKPTGSLGVQAVG